MKKFHLFLIALSLIAGILFAHPFLTRAQQEVGGNENNGEGNDFPNVNQPCEGLKCGCYNQGSALGKTCGPGLSTELVTCSGQEQSQGLCEASGPGGKTITKCVNPECSNNKDCVCLGTPVEPTIDEGGPPNVLTPTPTPAPGCFNDCAGNGAACPAGLECHDVTGGSGSPKYKCVPATSFELGCAADNQACWCSPCGCSAVPGDVFTCPGHPNGQIGKIEGPVFGGGAVPACFVCDSKFGGCAKLTPGSPPPQPTIRLDELDGNQCKRYEPIAEIGAPTPIDSVPCACDGEICCPKCQAPIVVGGTCDPSCNFDVEGPEAGGSCACFGGRCNNFTVESPPGYSFDWGSSGAVPAPDVSCVKFPNAGVKIVELQCPGGGTCRKEIVIACSCDNVPQPSPASPSWDYTAWYKVKDDQFHKIDNIIDPIPDPVSPFDADDVPEGLEPACDVNDPTDIRCFNLNQAGIVSTGGDTINVNGAPISHREWSKLAYTKTSLYTPESFLDYALARKTTNIIESSDDLASLQKDKINILNDNLLVRNSTDGEKGILDILEDPARAPYVLIVRGTVTVDVDINVATPVTDSPLPIAIIAEGGEGVPGALRIHHSVETMGGIWIGDTLDFSYDTDHSPYPLKVKGNIISYAAANPLKRQRIDDPTKPSVFVVFDPILYLNISHLLTVRTYDWSEQSQ